MSVGSTTRRGVVFASGSGRGERTATHVTHGLPVRDATLPSRSPVRLLTLTTLFPTGMPASVQVPKTWLISTAFMVWPSTALLCQSM